MTLLIILLWMVIIGLSFKVIRKLRVQKQLTAGDGLGILGIVVSVILSLYAAQQSPAPAGTVSGVVAPPTKAVSIELAALISMFLKSDANAPMPWDIGARADSPIDWHDDGIGPERSPDTIGSNSGPIGPSSREGDLVLTIDGKAWGTHLGKTASPGRWTIVAGGPRAGIDRVVLVSQEFAGEILPSGIGPYLERNGFETKRIRCPSREEPGNLSSGNQLLEIRKNSAPAWLEESWTSGSAGCSEEFDLMLFKDFVENIKCTADGSRS